MVGCVNVAKDGNDRQNTDVRIGERGGPVTIRTVGREALHLAAIRVEGTFQELGERVPAAWLQLHEQLPALLRTGPERLYYGVTPDATHTGGAGPVLTYWVGVSVEKDAPIPAQWERLTVPGGVYAQVTASGDRAQIGAAYEKLANWLADAGAATDPAGYAVEVYDASRQSPFPPYTNFDFDLLRPLAG